MFFESLDIYSKILLYIAVSSTILFIGRLILMLFIGDHQSLLDIHSDSNISSEEIFTIASFQSISTFLMSFGWVGFFARAKWHFGFAVSMIIAVIFGFAMVLFMVYLFMQMKKLNKITEFDIYDCIGACGKAYTHLKPDKIGQVQVVVDGKLMTLNAINKSKETISSFSQIIVTNIENNTLIVSEYKGE